MNEAWRRGTSRKEKIPRMKWRTATFPESANPAPAVGLIQLGQKRMEVIRLEDLRSALVLLGAGEGCHIRVDHVHVSARHLAFIRQGTSWTITSCPTAKNTTRVGGIPLKHGLELELPAGIVIRIGHAAWVTIGAQYQPGTWRIAAQSRDEFYTAALFVYGSARKAATILGVDPRTYTRALHRIPEADAFLRRKAAREDKRHDSPFAEGARALAFPFHAHGEGMPVLSLRRLPRGPVHAGRARSA